MKPVCYPCNEFIDENSLSTLFGKDYAENLVYELYIQTMKRLKIQKLVNYLKNMDKNSIMTLKIII